MVLRRMIVFPRPEGYDDAARGGPSMKFRGSFFPLIVRISLAWAASLIGACAKPVEPGPSLAPARDAIFFVAGDALLTRVPGRRLRENGHAHIFEKMKSYIQEADAAFLNLETPISTRGVPFPGKPANVTFRADPIAAFALKDAGFDVVSLANNHMNDHGPLAVVDTLQYLDLAGIAHAGAGRNDMESRSPAIVRAGEWRIGILSYVQPWWSVTRAGKDTPGVAHAIIEDMLLDISALKASGTVDFIAVSIHWGDEHAIKPNEYQTEMARSCIDGGADIVLGHHPHVLQGLERRRQGAIFYSLGNFVFDMEASSTYETVAAFISMGEGGVGGIELLPVVISRATSQPEVARGTDLQRILERFRKLSADLGTDLKADGKTKIVDSLESRLVSYPSKLFAGIE